MRDEIIFAYLAGLMDGEGSFMIRKSFYRVRNKKYGDCKNPMYTPRVGVKNTNREVIELMKSIFGGHMSKEKRVYQSKNGHKRRKILYIYNAEHRIALNICEKLLPYLIIKKEQAKLLLELDKLKEKAKKDRDKSIKGFHGKPYKKEYIEKFEELYQRVKELNR